MLATTCLVSSIAVLAQSARIAIPLRPRPDQMVRYHTVQEVRFALPFPGAAADPSPSSAAAGTIVANTDSVHTLAVSAPDAQGHAEARFTYEQFTMQMSLNGQPMPVPLPTDSILHQPFTFIVDRDGRTIDVKGTDGNAAVMAAIRPLFGGALSGPASLTLAPGESTTVPLSAEVPLPLPGVVNNGALAITGEMKYTLVSVEGAAAGRVAHLTTTLTGRVVGQDIQTPAGTMSMAMTMTGDGTLDVNADRGIVTLQKQRQMIDIQIQPGAAAGAAVPPMKMSGTITLTVSAE